MVSRAGQGIKASGVFAEVLHGSIPRLRRWWHHAEPASVELRLARRGAAGQGGSCAVAREQSLRTIVAAGEGSPPFDAVVVDEARRTSIRWSSGCWSACAPSPTACLLTADAEPSPSTARVSLVRRGRFAQGRAPAEPPLDRAHWQGGPFLPGRWRSRRGKAEETFVHEGDQPLLRWATG